MESKLSGDGNPPHDAKDDTSLSPPTPRRKLHPAFALVADRPASSNMLDENAAAYDEEYEELKKKARTKHPGISEGKTTVVDDRCSAMIAYTDAKCKILADRLRNQQILGKSSFPIKLEYVETSTESLTNYSTAYILTHPKGIEEFENNFKPEFMSFFVRAKKIPVGANEATTLRLLQVLCKIEPYMMIGSECERALLEVVAAMARRMQPFAVAVSQQSKSIGHMITIVESRSTTLLCDTYDSFISPSFIKNNDVCWGTFTKLREAYVAIYHTCGPILNRGPRINKNRLLRVMAKCCRYCELSKDEYESLRVFQQLDRDLTDLRNRKGNIAEVEASQSISEICKHATTVFHWDVPELKAMAKFIPIFGETVFEHIMSAH